MVDSLWFKTKDKNNATESETGFSQTCSFIWDHKRLLESFKILLIFILLSINRFYCAKSWRFTTLNPLSCQQTPTITQQQHDVFSKRYWEKLISIMWRPCSLILHITHYPPIILSCSHLQLSCQIKAYEAPKQIIINKTNQYCPAYIFFAEEKVIMKLRELPETFSVVYI